MLLAALGALFAFVGAFGAAKTAQPATMVVETWRMYGFVVFAGLFVLLALFPRHYPGVWELVIFHKVAMSATAATLTGGGAADASLVAAADGVVAAMVIVAYFLAKGYAGWVKPGADLS